MKCIAYGCSSRATQAVDVGFNELHGAELEPSFERIWVCREHHAQIAAEILAGEERP